MVERAPVVGPLVVLEDVLAVEVIHEIGRAQSSSKMRRTVPSPSISRSMSALVLWTAKLRARGRGDAERAHQRLRAVVAGTDADALAAEQLGDVVRVHADDRE